MYLELIWDISKDKRLDSADANGIGSGTGVLRATL